MCTSSSYNFYSILLSVVQITKGLFCPDSNYSFIHNSNWSDPCLILSESNYRKSVHESSPGSSPNLAMLINWRGISSLVDQNAVCDSLTDECDRWLQRWLVMSETKKFKHPAVDQIQIWSTVKDKTINIFTLLSKQLISLVCLISTVLQMCPVKACLQFILI